MKTGLENINPRYLLTTRRGLLMAGGLALGIAVVVIVVIVPQIQRDLTTWKTWQKEQVARDQLRKKVSQLQQVSGDATAEQAELVSQVLPSRKPLLELLSGLNQVALQTNVVFTSVELTPGSIATDAAATTPTVKKTTASKKAQKNPAKAKEYETLDVTLSVAGKLDDINRFFAAVERVAPATTLTSITLDKSKVTAASEDTSGLAQGEQPYTADVTVETYYFTKSISAALDAPLPTIGVAEQALLEQFKTYTLGTVTPQQRIEGGGLEDLFADTPAEAFNQLNQLLAPVATPAPTTPTGAVTTPANP